MKNKTVLLAVLPLLVSLMLTSCGGGNIDPDSHSTKDSTTPVTTAPPDTTRPAETTAAPDTTDMPSDSTGETNMDPGGMIPDSNLSERSLINGDSGSRFGNGTTK